MVGFLQAGWRLVTLRKPPLSQLPNGMAAFWLILFFVVCVGMLTTYLTAAPPRRFEIDAVQSDGWYAALVLLIAFVVARALERPALVWQIGALYLSAALWLSLAGWLLHWSLQAPGVASPGSDWLQFAALLVWSLLACERLIAAVAGRCEFQRRVGLALFMGLTTALPGLVLNYGQYWQTDYYAVWQARQENELPPLDAESLLIAQQQRVDQALAGLAPQRPGKLDVYFVGVAGDGSQDVFLRELHLAQHHLEQRFGASLRSLLLVNNRATVERSPLATATTLELALTGIAARMDRDQDLLLLYLTSHGTREHELIVDLADLPLQDLAARRLGEILARSGIPRRAVVVSACYSGGFIDSLADPRTLVLTAARADRDSFGCGDDEEMTYFGRALFERALPHAGSFAEAYDIARREVTAWEARDGFTPSDPQWSPAADVEARFAAWFASWPPAGR